MSEQLELPLNKEDMGAPPGASVFHPFTLHANLRLAAVTAWWDEVIAVALHAQDAAAPRLAAFAADLAHATGAKARRIRAARADLIAELDVLAEAARGTFEGALAEFSPQLITLLQAEGVEIADDDERAVVEFWECLHGPAYERCADRTLRELAQAFARELGASA